MLIQMLPRFTASSLTAPDGGLSSGAMGFNDTVLLTASYVSVAGTTDFTADFQDLITRYAWGEDYHDVLPARMKELVQFIEEQVRRPVKNRWYTDTGPILERDLAQPIEMGGANVFDSSRRDQ